MKNIKSLIKRAVKAVKSELKVVREYPSQEVLLNGEPIKGQNFEPDLTHIQFPTHNQSIQYAEEIDVTIAEKNYKAKPVRFNEDGIVLAFEKPPKDEPRRAELEWINDFVLKRLLDELQYLLQADSSKLKNIKALFEPENVTNWNDVPVSDDGQRNRAQTEAIQKSLQNRVLFIWGPPGTGKTSTLGYIVANLLKKDKKVLFASNTNRAVDIGMISVIEALQTIDEHGKVSSVTRYGDIALESKGLQEIHFERLMEEKMDRKKRKMAEFKVLAEQYTKTQNEIKTFENKGKEIPSHLKNHMKLLKQKVKKHGGKEAIVAEVEMSDFRNERTVLKKFKLIGTTLARVCSSELFGNLHFDALVIDEASMANLPYLLVLAAKADKHTIVVGDPMQLPPIALTDNRTSKKFLEKDIFTHVSGADSTGELFTWHDENPGITAFFDTQYRLKSELAGLISSVFYENRLKSSGRQVSQSENRSIFLLNSGTKHPSLTQKKDSRRYRPYNKVHLKILEKLVYKLVLKESISQKEIGIIVPFRSSVYDIRDMLRSIGLGRVEVGTIHTYQGREKRVIIFDTVMSGERYGAKLRHYSVRPFDEAKNGLSVHRLLNVAFSRSKSHLYVIADMNHIQEVYNSKFLGKLLKTLAKQQQMYNL